jgi:hypothetical protein
LFTSPSGFLHELWGIESTSCIPVASYGLPLRRELGCSNQRQASPLWCSVHPEKKCSESSCTCGRGRWYQAAGLWRARADDAQLPPPASRAGDSSSRARRRQPRVGWRACGVPARSLTRCNRPFVHAGWPAPQSAHVVPIQRSHHPSDCHSHRVQRTRRSLITGRHRSSTELGNIPVRYHHRFI